MNPYSLYFLFPSSLPLLPHPILSICISFSLQFDVNIDKKEAHKLDELRNMDATDTLETNTSESTPPTDLKF